MPRRFAIPTYETPLLRRALACCANVALSAMTAPRDRGCWLPFSHSLTEPRDTSSVFAICEWVKPSARILIASARFCFISSAVCRLRIVRVLVKEMCESDIRDSSIKTQAVAPVNPSVTRRLVRLFESSGWGCQFRPDTPFPLRSLGLVASEPPRTRPDPRKPRLGPSPLRRDPSSPYGNIPRRN